MARNGSGVYSLPATYNPVVPLTTIASAWGNTTLADIATALTDSLSRSGLGGMSATLTLSNGALNGTGGFNFAGDLSSGWYRNASGDFRFAVSGVDALFITTAASLPRFSFSSNQAAAGGQVDFYFSTTNTRSAGILFELDNNATGIFAISFDGIHSMGGANAGLNAITSNGGLVFRGNKNAADTGAETIIASQAATNRSAGWLTKWQNNNADVMGIRFDGAISNPLSNSTITFKGNRNAADAGTDIIFDTIATRTNGNIASFANNTTVKARVDFNGKGFFVGLDAASTIITNVATPVSSGDAATKGYVDGFSFTEPSLNANWTNGGTTQNVGYYKGPGARVFMKGQATAGAGAGTLFSFPSGFRPLATRNAPVLDVTAGTFAYWSILSNGTLQAGTALVNGHVYDFTAFSFTAEQ